MDQALGHGPGDPGCRSAPEGVVMDQLILLHKQNKNSEK